MSAMTWVTRGNLSGRWILMSNADNAAAIANNWASATPLEWKSDNTSVIAARDAAADTGAAANWYEKMSDPKYSVAVDDAGNYTPPTGGAITNITSTPSPLTVTQAGGANASCGTVAAVGGNPPVTFSVSPASSIWNISGSTVRKTNAGTSGYTLGTMTVGVKATGSDGESYTKTLNITVT
jgi:hypothetical protein